MALSLSLFKRIPRLIYQGYIDVRRINYRVLDIDLENDRVEMHFRGRRTVFYRCLSEVITDRRIITSLSSQQACCLGFNYGRLFLSDRLSSNYAPFSLPIKYKKVGYNIIAQTRSKEIVYTDSVTGNQYVEHPFAIIQNEYVMTRFDPGQACYLGFLAGIYFEKAKQSNKMKRKNGLEYLFSQRSHLRAVGGQF